MGLRVYSDAYGWEGGNRIEQVLNAELHVRSFLLFGFSIKGPGRDLEVWGGVGWGHGLDDTCQRVLLGRVCRFVYSYSEDLLFKERKPPAKERGTNSTEGPRVHKEPVEVLCHEYM